MNSFGTLFRITVYGESHGKAIGVIIDGMPAGIKIDSESIFLDMQKRKPSQMGSTPRKEDDEVNIMSGVFNGYSTGAPIHLMIENHNVKSSDYDELKAHPRPGHADFVAEKKYRGFQDHRGGGHFSGRLTAAIVAAGSIAKQIIPFKLSHQIVQIGEEKDPNKFASLIQSVADEKDSIGGIIEVKVTNMQVGLGEPIFDKLDAKIAQMMFAIPAVKALNIGTGFNGIHLRGSSFNDKIIDNEGKTETNHSGGISGGISNGNDLVLTVMIKPAASIGKAQMTYHLKKDDMESLEVVGRHDAAITLRAGIVLENALAIVLADHYLISKAYQ